MSKSYTSAPHAITKAIQSLAPYFGDNLSILTPGTIADLYTRTQEQTKVDFIDGKASQGTSVPVNEFLTAKGFTLQLPEISGSTIASAGVVDIAVSWVETAKLVDLKLSSGKTVPGVEFEEFSVFNSPELSNPVIKLDAKLGETSEYIEVYFSRSDTIIPDDFVSLQDFLSKLTLKRYFEPTTNFVTPAINLDISGALPVLNGINIRGTTGEVFTTQEGAFQAILKLNEKGARAKAAVGLLCGCSAMNVPLNIIIDGPFYIWFKYQGVVYFAAHIFEDVMALPENLD